MLQRYTSSLMFAVLSLTALRIAHAQEATLVCIPLAEKIVTLCIRNQADGGKEWSLVSESRQVLDPAPRVLGEVSGMLLSPDRRFLLVLARSADVERMLVFDVAPILKGKIGAIRHELPFPPGVVSLRSWQGNRLLVSSRFDLSDGCMEDTGRPSRYLFDPASGEFDLHPQN